MRDGVAAFKDVLHFTPLERLFLDVSWNSSSSCCEKRFRTDGKVTMAMVDELSSNESTTICKVKVEVNTQVQPSNDAAYAQLYSPSSSIDFTNADNASCVDANHGLCRQSAQSISIDTQNLGQLNVSWSQYKQQRSQACATGGEGGIAETNKERNNGEIVRNMKVSFTSINIVR
ncbi:hypothetical protein Tco_1145931 [Tanacetum coccineum]